MLYRTYIPKAPLAEFVELFWFYDGFPQRSHKKERLMPDGSTEVVINLRQDEIRVYDREKLERFDRFGGGILCGPHSNFFVIDTEEQASVIGIHFKPGGAFPFFKLPVDELHNQHVGLDDLWGTEASLLRERLLEAATPEDKFKVLEDCLTEQAFKPLHRHPAVGFALTLFGNMDRVRTIAEVTDQIGLSPRRFIQLFSGQVGLTPKLFCRVRRFQQVLKMVHTAGDFDWVDIAANCGYFDQAHFIHDFKAFSGINPTTYATSKTEHLNHVPILE
jgi:AraC-like DNA-binding protein